MLIFNNRADGGISGYWIESLTSACCRHHVNHGFNLDLLDYNVMQTSKERFIQVMYLLIGPELLTLCPCAGSSWTPRLRGYWWNYDL